MVVGGGFKKQGYVHMRLVLRGLQEKYILVPAHRISSFVEALTGLSHITCAGGLNPATVSKPCPGGSLWEWGMQAEATFQGQEEPLLLGSSPWTTSGHIFSGTFPNKYIN